MVQSRRKAFEWWFFFLSSRRRHTRLQGDWSSDVCSSDLSPPSWLRADRKTLRTRPPFNRPWKAKGRGTQKPRRRRRNRVGPAVSSPAGRGALSQFADRDEVQIRGHLEFVFLQRRLHGLPLGGGLDNLPVILRPQIGRASCRERV